MTLNRAGEGISNIMIIIGILLVLLVIVILFFILSYLSSTPFPNPMNMMNSSK